MMKKACPSQWTLGHKGGLCHSLTSINVSDTLIIISSRRNGTEPLIWPKIIFGSEQEEPLPADVLKARQYEAVEQRYRTGDEKHY